MRNGSPSRPPLLFVHGAWHGAWCWQRHFVPYFEARGFECHAIDLRGHGERDPAELRGASVDDYVADVAEAAKSLDAVPILIGHSMGGFVVQRYLQREHPAAGAALLAPAPPWGVWRTTLGIARKHPLKFLEVNTRLRLLPLVSSEALVREFFFCHDLPNEELAEYAAQLGDESYRAFLDMLTLVKPKPEPRAPMFVLAGELDVLFRVKDMQATAKRYGTEAVVVEGLAHDVMLDVRWRDAATALHEWLGTTFD